MNSFTPREGHHTHGIQMYVTCTILFIPFIVMYALLYLDKYIDTLVMSSTDAFNMTLKS